MSCYHYNFAKDPCVPDVLKSLVASLRSEIVDEALGEAVESYLDRGEVISFHTIKTRGVPLSEIEKAEQLHDIVNFCWEAHENANYVANYR